MNIESAGNGEWRNKPENIEMSSRGIEMTEQFLGVDRGYWEGKKILDLGAGYGGTFEIELRDEVPSAKVFSLSKHFKNKEDTMYWNPETELWEESDARMVAGDALALPFADNSFDSIVSFLSTPHYLNNLEEYRKSLEEIARVLVEGGEARLMPGFSQRSGEREMRHFDTEEVLGMARELGFEASEYNFLSDDPEGKYNALILKKQVK